MFADCSPPPPSPSLPFPHPQPLYTHPTLNAQTRYRQPPVYANSSLAMLNARRRVSAGAMGTMTALSVPNPSNANNNNLSIRFGKGRRRAGGGGGGAGGEISAIRWAVASEVRLRPYFPVHPLPSTTHTAYSPLPSLRPRPTFSFLPLPLSPSFRICACVQQLLWCELTRCE